MSSKTSRALIQRIAFVVLLYVVRCFTVRCFKLKFRLCRCAEQDLPPALVKLTPARRRKHEMYLSKPHARASRPNARITFARLDSPAVAFGYARAAHGDSH